MRLDRKRECEANGRGVMKKPIRNAGLGLLAILIILQLFQPDRNLGEIGSGDNMVAITGMPEDLANILRNSCFDCHSNHTEYPWYSYISPISWYLESHISKGQTHMNFDNFGKLEKNRKIGVLAEICDEIETGSMPLKSYLLIHRKAVVGEKEKEVVCSWTEQEALKIMRE